MIAWAGVEMFEAGYTSDIGVLATTAWPMDPRAEGGGIVEVGGWVKSVE
jgi:N6-L-threonylcarbamoyladenine synthase